MTDVTFEAGRLIHGFNIQWSAPLPDLRGTATLMEHAVSGARLIHIATADPENLFAIAFRTPPPDDTGLPHILEHTVLCGSKRYPVKDPFVELLKTSLATFLNAMTYPDRTVYPCASMNPRDFANLMSVYCDAVFHPRITEEHFKQEGHRLDWADPDNPDSPLTIKGIVYNEMKGAYSTLDGTIYRTAAAALFPDTAYGRDSAGSPEAIPSLTYAQFIEFHRRYYHPSNAFIFLYGNTPPEPHLAFLDETCLSNYRRIDVDTGIAPQPRWTEPRRMTVPYPAAPDDRADRQSAWVIEWLACPSTDIETTLAMGILSEYLLAHDGSPLRRALVDSGIGEDLIADGYSTYRRDTSFSVGLRGIDAARAGDVERLVFDTLASVAAGGVDAREMESVFHQFELAALDIPPMFPLALMDRVLGPWMYDQHPLTVLRIREHLAALRRRAEGEPGYFESVLRRLLIDNPHRLVMTLVPDAGLQQRHDQALAERMAAVRASLPDEALQRIRREGRELEARQGEPNSPEALATLPRLHPADVPPDPLPLPVETGEVAGRPLVRADALTNGIGYVRLALDLRGLDDGLWDYLPLFAYALTKTGAAGGDFAAAARREAAVCAGIGASPAVGERIDAPGVARPTLYLSTQGLDDHAGAMLDLVRDRLVSADFSDLARLDTLLVQYQAGLREDVVESGNAYASRRAQRGLSETCALRERLGGVSQVRFARRLAESGARDPAALAAAFERIRAAALVRGRLTAAFVGSDAAFRRMSDWYEALVRSLPEGGPGIAEFSRDAPRAPAEGIAAPSEVAFVAQAMPAVPADHPLAPAWVVLSTRLSLDYLWTEVRVKRGAYGCSAGLGAGAGTFVMSSFRDPCICETLDTFARIPDVVAREMDFSREAVEQSVIGAVKTLDKPIRPKSAVATALGWRLDGVDDAFRRRFRTRLLSVTADDMRRVAEEHIRPGLAAAPVCIVAGREKLEAAKHALRGLEIEEL